MKNVFVNRDFLNGLIDWAQNVEQPFVDDRGNPVKLCDHKDWRTGNVTDDTAIDAGENIHLWISCPICEMMYEMIIGPDDPLLRKDLKDNLRRTGPDATMIKHLAPLRKKLIRDGLPAEAIDFVCNYLAASIPPSEVGILRKLSKT
jgi:hypothetical protein